ncbi:hypothetical protein [Xanthomonas phaseoli]|uniref:hypothetical protein n=1 Tax=Xanthomonas phaseoli TaxID=1985254 RepID=UPI000364FBA5|nr:hypothetical protein [Xanthomonas phaseoli]RWU12456.1 hypothetical protein XANMN_23340 [Xanthomonas phaseoli pv. manihotis str. CIO151]UEQ13642.1 hypothetical protein K9838_12980 [Xanthomonas phaseoli pv. manihotis]
MILKVITQLLAPAGYLRIRTDHGEKLVIDWLFPALAALAVTAVWVRWPTLMPLRGDKGFVSSIGSLMQVLVGFYVAALAAVATFPSGPLDQEANGMKLRGKGLKRRLFLASLFGYLALLGLVLLTFSLFREVPSLLAKNLGSAATYVVPGLLFVYQFVFWQMVFITLLGLYYLSDRVHRS